MSKKTMDHPPLVPCLPMHRRLVGTRPSQCTASPDAVNSDEMIVFPVLVPLQLSHGWQGPP